MFPLVTNCKYFRNKRFSYNLQVFYTEVNTFGEEKEKKEHEKKTS